MTPLEALRTSLGVLVQFTEQNPKHPITHHIKVLTAAIDLQLHENMAAAATLRFDNERLRAKLAEANAEAARLRERLSQ